MGSGRNDADGSRGNRATELENAHIIIPGSEQIPSALHTPAARPPRGSGSRPRFQPAADDVTKKKKVQTEEIQK